MTSFVHSRKMTSFGCCDCLFYLSFGKIQSNHYPKFIKVKCTVLGFIIFYKRLYIIKQFIDSILI